MASWLDWQHPQLQHSSSLVLQPADALSLPASLQQQRVQQQLEALVPRQKPPVRLQPPLLALAAVLLLGLLLQRVWHPPGADLQEEDLAFALPASDAARAQLAEVERLLPELQEARLRLAPPGYTGLAARMLPLADLEAPEGSRITWQLVFNKAVRQVYLTNQKNDTLRFRQNKGGDWTAQLEAGAPLFYRIGYATTTDTAFSPYLKISLLPDEAPRLRILSPDQYLLEQPGTPFAVSVEASDDYGLQDVYLSLTISRGRGEGVSFRDEKIWLNSTTAVKGFKKAWK
ncbi:hypothetical protein ADICEAN_03509 [Cesiribacter andamanensis AMV16]|uniref:Uncharacterized protein n=1 Tax=Cesiribacter andamanensis AMV16 TaxID=1279009 RepID=M7N2D8_9BACT|nr:hypothetical protein ADICEAN_03509 [Cesiribacter andamanensis AMV16]